MEIIIFARVISSDETTTHGEIEVFSPFTSFQRSFTFVLAHALEQNVTVSVYKDGRPFINLTVNEQMKQSAIALEPAKLLLLSFLIHAIHGAFKPDEPRIFTDTYVVKEDGPWELFQLACA